MIADTDEFLSVNRFFSEFQGNINYLISRILNKEGLYVNANSQAIDLGNGRRVVTAGAWFSYESNVYNCSEETKFYELLAEETDVLMTTLPIIHGVASYLIEENPDVQEIDAIYPAKKKAEPVISQLVGEFINDIETKRRFDGNKKAISILRSAYDSSMSDIEISSVDDVLRLMDDMGIND